MQEAAPGDTKGSGRRWKGLQNTRRSRTAFGAHQLHVPPTGGWLKGGPRLSPRGRQQQAPCAAAAVLCQPPSSRCLPSVPRFARFPPLPRPLSHAARLLQKETESSAGRRAERARAGSSQLPLPALHSRNRREAAAPEPAPPAKPPSLASLPPPGHSPAKQGLAARQVVHAGSLEKQPVLNLCQTTKSHSEPAVPGKRRNLQTTEPLSTCFLEGRSHTTSQPGRHLLSGAPGLR